MFLHSALDKCRSITDSIRDVCPVFTVQAHHHDCPMHLSQLSFLYLQSDCLSIKYHSFLFFFTFLSHLPDTVMPMWCSFSTFHQLLLLLHLQFHSLSNSYQFFLSLHLFHSSLLRVHSFVNVVFTFSTSLMNLAPSSPIPFPVNPPSFFLSYSFPSPPPTTYIQHSQCCVHLQHFTHDLDSLNSNPIPCK